MSPLQRSNNIAARMGRWSAGHWKTAVFGWLVFVVAGSIDWTVVAPLAGGLLAGSTVGPVVARRVPAWLIRWVAAGLGFVLAVELWLHPH